MALTKNMAVLTHFGTSIELPNAYIKVASVVATKELISATVQIHCECGGPIAASVTHQLTADINSTNFIAQAYAHLKNLPEFADAMDC